MSNKIYDPLRDNISEIELIQACGSDKMIVNAARVSYGNDASINEAVTERDKKLIKFLLRHRHGTPFEHNLITFRVKAPLYVIQEMLRHRIGVSFNQESHRYIQPGQKSTEQGSPIRKYYVPQTFRLQDTKNKQSSIGSIDNELNDASKELYINSCDEAFNNYESLINKGVCREQARGVLPHCTYSSLYFTLNLRSLMHFLGLRLPQNAQWEIRQYAKCALILCEPIFPETFEIIKELGILQHEEND